jgi:sulfite dehydrogenase
MKLRNMLAALALAGAGAGAMLPAAQASDAAQLELGKALFTRLAVPACALCHTLKDANAVGEVGPVFDEIQPDSVRVANAVRNGIGVMPSFRNSLSEEQILALAKYVAKASGGAQ